MRKIRHNAGFYHVQYPSGHCHRDTNAEDTVKRKTVLELKKKMCYDFTYGTIIDTKKRTTIDTFGGVLPFIHWG